MVTMTRDNLDFNFSDVHAKAQCAISFQRTLRIPDDNREHFLPPGLGSFPLLHTEDFTSKTPEIWQKTGGVFLPMYQAEALWINFSNRTHYPCAVKIAAGKINAVTGEPWENSLSADPQDYVVLPTQPWLDGFSVGEGLIRQFVAMPLGAGYTAEEQLTGKADVGGIQICVYPMKREKYDKLQEKLKDSRIYYQKDDQLSVSECSMKQYSMGLAPGGLMRQQIYEDEYGIDSWDTEAMSRCFVHLVNSEQYLSITGSAPPTEPPSAKQYTDAGLPWFDYYAADKVALQGAKVLAGLDSVAAKMVKLEGKVLEQNDPVNPAKIISQGQKEQIMDGQW